MDWSADWEVVYLSGPISLNGTSSPDEIAAFEATFKEIARVIRGYGYEVIDPTECEPQASWADYMKIHIPSVCRADLLVMLPRWTESRGAMLEAFLAGQLGTPVVEARDLVKP